MTGWRPANSCEFLAAERAARRRYDLVIAADVFVYLFDLAPVVRAVADVLSPEGLFAFTVETHGGDGIELGEKLRYRHGAAHVRAAVAGGWLATLRTRAGRDPDRIRRRGAGPPRGCRQNVGWAKGAPFARRAHADASMVGTARRARLCPPYGCNSSGSCIRSNLVSVPRLEVAPLPQPFARWFASRGWAPREHQLALLEKARAGRSALLIAPTGGGKTLAGFLPTLVELSERARAPTGRALSLRSSGLHTLYISPLKALAVDVARNLDQPVAEMGLPIRIETRTGDTPASKRVRQRRYPPDILLTTPEQLALLLSTADAPYLFGTLQRIVLDELHALVTSKRGDLLSLGLARLYRLAPAATAIGLSATVAEPADLARYLVPQPPGGVASADLIIAEGGAAPVVTMLDTAERLPWASHSARHALGEMYELIKRHRTTLMFVNTRSQAEMLFQELWRINDDGLAIALHHGSLDAAQRRKIEAAMAAGRLQAVVCTSSLDLGIDWGDVDLVINVGAPKGASRLTQRIGRANHRLDEPSKAVLVPANRFEVLECQAAIEAVAEGAQDTPPLRTGAFDVLAQHVLGRACGEPFLPDDLYDEVRMAAPFAGLTRADFDAVVDFVATGGYALKVYERFAKIRQGKDGRFRVANPRVAQQYRLNVGTIVEETMIKVRLVRSRHARAAGRPA